MANGIGKTICEDGGLLTTLAMISDGCGFKVDGKPINPSTMNAWLGKNGGFNGDGTVNPEALTLLGFVHSKENNVNNARQAKKRGN